MKKLVLIIVGLLMMISCNSADDKVIIQDDDNPNQEPNNPNRGINMNLALAIEFVNDDGINIIDPVNQMVNGNDLDVDVYGINGYEDEYPFTNTNEDSYLIHFGTTNYEPYAYSLILNNYEDKSEILQQVFGERGWLQYKITFPDGAVYEVKVEGAIRTAIGTNVDYYATKIYVNDVIKWQQPQGSYSGYMDLTIVK